MKFFTKIMLLSLVLALVNCERKPTMEEFTDSFPDYRLIKRFSKRLNQETGITLYCYGRNQFKSEKQIRRYGKNTFDISYLCKKNKDTVIPLEEARCTLVSIAESLLEEINSDLDVRPILDVYPQTYDWIELCIHFEDENNVDLKNGGISIIYFRRGEIRYETIENPEGKPSKRRVSTDYKEPYEKALEIVKEQGCLQHY